VIASTNRSGLFCQADRATTSTMLTRNRNCVVFQASEPGMPPAPHTMPDIRLNITLDAIIRKTPRRCSEIMGMVLAGSCRGEL